MLNGSCLCGGVTYKISEPGEDLIARYESSKGFFRCFCGQCGSVLPEQVEGAEYNFVPAGGLDDDVSIRPEKHIFAASKATWHQISDDLPQVDTYDEIAEDQGLVSVEQTDRSNQHNECVGGSCLCGDVAFKFSAGSGNSFCKKCGSSVPRKAEGAPAINIPAGSLDDSPGIEPKANIFVGSKANWFEISDQIPQHDEMPQPS